MDIRTFLTLVFLVFLKTGYAQQVPLFLQSRDNNPILNPAAISDEYFLYEKKSGFQATMLNYALSSDIAPKTGVISGYTILGEGDIGTKLLIGGNVIWDDEGFTETIKPQFRIAGIIPFDSGNDKLVVGLSGGWSQFRIKTDDVQLVDAGDLKGMTGLTQWHPDFSLGIFYSNRLKDDENYFYAGISIPQIFSLNKNISNGVGEYNIERKMHYAATLGFQNDLSDNGHLEPSVRILFLPNFPVFFDANLRWKCNRLFWLGGGAANNGFVHGEFGFSPSIGKTKNRLAFSMTYNFPVFKNELSPFGNNLELRVRWTK